MGKTEIEETLRSKICWIVMALAVFFLGLLMRDELKGAIKKESPAAVAANIMAIIVFFALFAVSLACMIKITKERIRQAKNIDKKSVWNIVLYLVGFTTLQTCFMSGVCGVNLALPILTMFLPITVVDFMSKYGLYILLSVDALLFLSLLQMKCFKTEDISKKIKISTKLN